LLNPYTVFFFLGPLSRAVNSSRAGCCPFPFSDFHPVPPVLWCVRILTARHFRFFCSAPSFAGFGPLLVDLTPLQRAVDFDKAFPSSFRSHIPLAPSMKPPPSSPFPSQHLQMRHVGMFFFLGFRIFCYLFNSLYIIFLVPFLYLPPPPVWP